MLAQLRLQLQKGVGLLPDVDRDVQDAAFRRLASLGLVTEQTPEPEPPMAVGQMRRLPRRRPSWERGPLGVRLLELIGEISAARDSGSP